jgi:soluble lytic murein transglycosylase-like protein
MKFLMVMLTVFFSQAAISSCFDLASEEFKIDRQVLYAIAKVESNLDANSININKNRTLDIGIMQINSIHQKNLAEKGIALNELLDPCKNIIVGAWILKKNILMAKGDLWKGVGLYHSATPELQKNYIQKVRRIYARLND